jgi:hypothetical protein
MFFKMPWSAIIRMIYKNSEAILQERCRKTQKSMKLVIVPNVACEQHNDVFLLLMNSLFHIGIVPVVDQVID